MFSYSSQEPSPVTTAALAAHIARLESIQDVQETQWQELDYLLRLVGFEAGVASLKESARELLLCQCEDDN